jgi:hypothetical protein
MKKVPLAVTTANKSEQTYEPPDWAWRYLASLLDWEIKPTISARCEHAGVSRPTFYEYSARPEFVKWLDDHCEKIIRSEHREVRTALLRKCLTGDLEAIKLWHELYAEFIPTRRQIVSDERELSDRTDGELIEIARTLAAASAPATKIH